MPTRVFYRRNLDIFFNRILNRIALSLFMYILTNSKLTLFCWWWTVFIEKPLEFFIEKPLENCRYFFFGCFWKQRLSTLCFGEISSTTWSIRFAWAKNEHAGCGKVALELIWIGKVDEPGVKLNQSFDLIWWLSHKVSQNQKYEKIWNKRHKVQLVLENKNCFIENYKFLPFVQPFKKWLYKNCALVQGNDSLQHGA